MTSETSNVIEFPTERARSSTRSAEEERLERLRANTARMEAETIRHTGSKYAEVKGLDPAEIAKRIRADIKAEVKAGRLPHGAYSVRTSKYSGGATIYVRAEGLALQQSASVAAVRAALEAIVAAYERSATHAQSDYFSANFYGDVSVRA
jgi:hypothetical protein